MRRLILGLATLFTASSAEAQAPPDGRIVDSVRCAAHNLSHEQYVSRYEDVRRANLAANDSIFRVRSRTKSDTVEYEGARRELLSRQPMPKEIFDSTLHSGRYECLKIKYMSDGLRVAGFIFRPALQPGRRYPVIIYNRGGNREFGAVSDLQMSWWLRFLDEGYVVVASQYRGVDGGEGREEFGGADVDDVVNLIPLVRSLSYADTSNVFMDGASRGGMMAYIALARGMPVNAAVVEYAPVDLAGQQRFRPGFDELWAEMIPDFARHRQEFYRSRSAILWAERLHTPLLILQGTADWRVDPRDALRMADRLQQLGRPYSLVMYAGDDHGLPKSRLDREQRILEWFRAYRAPAASRP
ncbi:MAG TPA: prolyl oligopeptidase family serine peptidase [Gemmatimonadaceae bacterium]